MLLSCPYCDFTSGRVDGLQNHLDKMHPDLNQDEYDKALQRTKCKTCGEYTYIRYMKDGECKSCAKKGSGIVCPICNKPVRKNLEQHINRSHKGISIEEKFSAIGKTSHSCPICGKDTYSSDYKHRGLCESCFEKYHVNCHICSFPIVWSPADHYGKAHGTKPPQFGYGELAERFCEGCGKSLGFKRVLNRNRCDVFDKVCPECQSSSVFCPNCGKPVLRSKSLFAHLISCFNHTTGSIVSYINSLPEGDLKDILFSGLEKFREQGKVGNKILSDSHRGKTFDEIFGVEKSKEIREKISSTMIRNGSGGVSMRDSNLVPQIVEKALNTRRMKYGSNLLSEQGRETIVNRMKTKNPLFGISLISAQETSVVEHNLTRHSKIATDFFQLLDFTLKLSGSHFGTSEWVIPIPKELGLQKHTIFVDYYNPHLRLAIEFDGTYWHKSETLRKFNQISDELRNSLITKLLNPKYFFVVKEEDKDRMFQIIVDTVIHSEQLNLLDTMRTILFKREHDLNATYNARTLE